MAATEVTAMAATEVTGELTSQANKQKDSVRGVSGLTHGADGDHGAGRAHGGRGDAVRGAGGGAGGRGGPERSREVAGTLPEVAKSAAELAAAPEVGAGPKGHKRSSGRARAARGRRPRSRKVAGTLSELAAAPEVTKRRPRSGRAELAAAPEVLPEVAETAPAKVEARNLTRPGSKAFTIPSAAYPENRRLHQVKMYEHARTNSESSSFVFPFML